MYKVVVVEDESMVRKGIILTIDWSALDCVVVGDAANGEEGVELVDRLKPDIVVSDVKMPRMDGVEMIEQLRKQGCKAKFIILTAYSDFKYAQSALRLGVSDYLLKPLKDGELEGAVRKILSVVEVGATQAEEEVSMVIHLRSAKMPRINTWNRPSGLSRPITGRTLTSVRWRLIWRSVRGI